jgi:hypothetical protein
LNVWGWALGRALQYAVATAVVALLVTTLLAGADAERFASTGYVAAIAIAVLLTIRWFSPAAPASSAAAGPAFPAFLTFAVGVAILLFALSALIEQPGAEVRAIAVCFALIGVAAIVRAGALVSFNAKLAAGNSLSVAIRYVIAAALAALGVSALLASGTTDALARFAYAAALVATVLLTAALVAPTRVGAWAQASWDHMFRRIWTPASAAIFTRTLQYALGVAIAALILASVLPDEYAERFATTAYLAMLFAAFAILMRSTTRLAPFEDPSAGDAFASPARFAAVVVGALVLGAALAFSSIGEALAVAGFLYAIGAAIAKSAPRTIPSQ